MRATNGEHVSTAERAEWVTVATCATGLEADIARNVLEAANIPVLSQSNSAGIFGLSFQGNVTGGIALQVPSPELDRARALLNDDPADSIDSSSDSDES